MNKPLVSIGSITYNHGDYIKQAIESWLMQKNSFEIEIVIGEDCSTDNTRSIIEEYRNKHPNIIKVITSERNMGMIPNFMRTLQSCRGKYIALCEGDDYWTDPYKLQKQVDFLEANPDYGLVSGDVELIDENGDPIPDNQMVLRQRENYKSTVGFFDLLKTNQINTLTVCGRADLIKPLAERVVKENLWYVFDYWFWLNISLKSKIRVFDEKMANYRVHSAGASRQKDFFTTRKYKMRLNAIHSALTQKRYNSFILIKVLIRENTKELIRRLVKLIKKVTK